MVRKVKIKFASAFIFQLVYDVIVNKVDAGLIILTYKGKMLLMHRSLRPAIFEQKIWSLIGCEKTKNESCEEAIAREVEGEISIKLDAVELLFSLFDEDRKKYLYHAELTDDNVNNIKREDGQSLEFFTPKELRKLVLTDSTKLFLSKHSGNVS